MTDLELAKNNLAEHTICLIKGDHCIYSDKRGIAPIMGFIEAGLPLDGYSVADRVVGKAAAMLFVKCGIINVFAKTLSASGKKVLEEHGIKHEFETLTDRIINRAGTDTCPMEKAVLDTEDIESAYLILKKKIELMKTDH